MFLIGGLFELCFFYLCGWVGWGVVKLLTFGRVDLDWGDSAESFLTQVIGFGFLLAVALAVTMMGG
jgi:hypothetical protein